MDMYLEVWRLLTRINLCVTYNRDEGLKAVLHIKDACYESRGALESGILKVRVLRTSI